MDMASAIGMGSTMGMGSTVSIPPCLKGLSFKGLTSMTQVKIRQLTMQSQKSVK